MCSVLRVSFKTVGCRLNQAETASFRAALLAAGMDVVEHGERCDVCVIHTCAITANAVKTCARLARSARSLPWQPRVVMAGCAVAMDRADLARQTGADLLLDQSEKLDIAHRIAALVGKDVAADALRDVVPVFNTTRAYLKVQDGCDRHCTYCVVPAVRGAPTSRPPGDIIAEARELAASGFRELVLTGANLGLYAPEKGDLVSLIRGIEAVPGIQRLRIGSLELGTPGCAGILQCIKSSALVCDFLHIPLQSGDSDVLKAMNRPYGAQQFRDFVQQAALHIPGIGLGTDIIVGFPGETDEAYERTFEMIAALPFSNLHVFKYSPRPGTPAFALASRVPASIAERRSARLIELGKKKRRQFAQSFLGRPCEILVESIRDGVARGWLPQYIEAQVRLSGEVTVNQRLQFVPHTLRGDKLHL